MKTCEHFLPYGKLIIELSALTCGLYVHVETH